MILSVGIGDRVLLRAHPWRVRKVTSAADDRCIPEVEALEGVAPVALSAVVPPQQAILFPSEDVRLDPGGLDCLDSWSRGLVEANGQLRLFTEPRALFLVAGRS